MNWKVTLTILCLFGFLKEFRPPGMFISIQWTKFTIDQITQFVSLILVFLLTDLLRYKPIILLCGISGIATYLLAIFGTTIHMMQALLFTYGLFMSTEVVYYTYIYTKVDKKLYEKVTSITRATILIGKFGAGIIVQRLIAYNPLDYLQLYYLYLTAIILGTVCALFLPSVDTSIYVHKGDGNTGKIQSNVNDIRLELEHQPGPSTSIKRKRGCSYLRMDFLQSISNFEVVKWSLWWAMATCGYLQVQNLWEPTIRMNDLIYNGAIEAIFTIIAVATVSCVGIIKINWTQYGDAALASFSILKGLLLILAINTSDDFVMCGCYIAFGVIYHTLMTVASFEVAKRIPEYSYGLIFGINTFVALAVQYLLMFFIMSGNFVETTIRDQFIIYTCSFIGMGLIFTTFAIRKFFKC